MGAGIPWVAMLTLLMAVAKQIRNAAVVQFRQPLQQSLLRESRHLPKLQSYPTAPVRPNRFRVY